MIAAAQISLPVCSSLVTVFKAEQKEKSRS